MNRLSISLNTIIYFQNNQVSTNLNGISLVLEINFTICKNNNFYFNNHPKSFAKEKKIKI